MNNSLLHFLICTAMSIASYGQQLVGVGAAGGYKGPFERGFQYALHCSNYPESWARGSVWLDKQTGLLTMQIQLETDATHAGPKAQVLAFIYDASGNLIARVASSEVGLGGKPPGSAVITTSQASFNCGPDIGRRASQVVVQANYLGPCYQLWGITLSTVYDAMGLLQQFAIFFF